MSFTPGPCEVWHRRDAVLFVVVQGEPKAQAVLGASYANGGKGSPEDDIEAEKLFRKSAEQGWAEGQFRPEAADF